MILALDLATRTGWACRLGMGTFDLSVRRDESAGMRLVRLRSKLAEIYKTELITLLVFEAARHAAPAMQGALTVQAELQGVVKLWCEDMAITYRGYSPSEIKKHATGKGNAGKDVMLKLAKARWPELNFEDDNQADARWLLDLAEKDYGCL